MGNSSFSIKAIKNSRYYDTRDYADLAKFLGNPVGYLVSEEQILDSYDWWLANLYPLLKSGGIDKEVLRCYPGLKRGVAAFNRRHGVSVDAYYRPQVNLYREYWAKLTGRQVKEVKLLFTNALSIDYMYSKNR